MRMILARQRGPLRTPSFYEGKPRPTSEVQMHHDCRDWMEALGWRLVAHEWPVVRGREEFGRGDLVFQKRAVPWFPTDTIPKGPIYLVIEAKRRRGAKVRTQARFYAGAWALQYAEQAPPKAVVAYGIWTTSSQEILGYVPSHRAAADICWTRFGAHRPSI